MLANVTRLSLKNFSAGRRAFAERFLACEINLRSRLSRFSFLFRFWITFLELESHIFLIVQHEKRFERPTLAGNEALKQIRFSAREQFVHLFSLDWPLQNDFARSEIAALIRAD